MEKLLSKVDVLIESVLAEFEKKPVSSALKALIVVWAFKKIQIIFKS